MGDRAGGFDSLGGPMDAGPTLPTPIAFGLPPGPRLEARWAGWPVLAGPAAPPGRTNGPSAPARSRAATATSSRNASSSPAPGGRNPMRRPCPLSAPLAPPSSGTPTRTDLLQPSTARHFSSHADAPSRPRHDRCLPLWTNAVMLIAVSLLHAYAPTSPYPVSLSAFCVLPPTFCPGGGCVRVEGRRPRALHR